MAKKTKRVIEHKDMSVGAGKIKSLLEAGADANTRFEGGVTPLMSAAVHGDVATIDVLLQAGADLDLQQDHDSMTALMKAAWWKQVRAAAKLIAAGAGVNIATRHGWTALIYAVESGSNEIVKLLLQAGADPKARDDSGRTALDHAQDKGYTEIAALIKDD